MHEGLEWQWETFDEYLSALNKKNMTDKLLQFFCTLGMSIPSFFSAILFSWFFGFWYGIAKHIFDVHPKIIHPYWT